MFIKSIKELNSKLNFKSNKQLLNKVTNLNDKVQVRNYLLLHEYVSMGLMKEYDIKIPNFK